MQFSRHHDRPHARPVLLMMSFIDVVFLLLIFFILTSTLDTPENDLPSALQASQESAGSSNLQPQVVDVVTLEGRPAFMLGSQEARTREELVWMLEKLPKAPGVFVRVSGDVPVHAAATALQAARDAGHTKISYVPAS
ncbi:MAG: biopolymer transporter ExbD [Planctomycetota bacterium]